jgi:hypothetical protein
MVKNPTRAATQEPLIHKSLGLNALMQELQGRTAFAILDLGPARGVNIEFWSQFGSKIYVEDLFRSMPLPVNVDAEEEAGPSPFDTLFDYGPDTRFDVVLAWDLFNYFEQTQLEALVQRLARVCHAGTYVFALISNLHDIPAQPTVFRIIDHERLHYESNSSGTRPCPRYQPRDIARLMSRFRVASSFLLRHGIQEYLFLCEQPA